jgi:hypothetical protein
MIFAHGCGDDDGGGTPDIDAATDSSVDIDSDTDMDAATDVDADTTADADTDVDGNVAQGQWIGSACSCTGQGCDQMGVPVPNGGTIEGCDDVPTDWTGGDKACMRSYGGDFANNTYFANGYCSLMATACEGDSLICDSAVMGDFAAMTECPAGTVMIQDTQEVTVMTATATLQNKNCAITCTGAGQCREDEVDPVFNDEPTQYECIDKNGVQFCFDPRNLSPDYTATEF